MDIPTFLQDDYIDSRDIIGLRDELGDLIDEGEATEEDRDLFEFVNGICEEGADYVPDWEWGETLIADHAFQDYAQEFAHDCGMAPDTNQWPNYCIDWERAARDLQMDYYPIEIDGTTYWARG